MQYLGGEVGEVSISSAAIDDNLAQMTTWTPPPGPSPGA